MYFLNLIKSYFWNHLRNLKYNVITITGTQTQLNELPQLPI